MNAPERTVRPNANRWVPGVELCVAAPSCAWDLTSFAISVRVFPRAEGNPPADGCSAAASSSTAGGSELEGVLRVAVAADEVAEAAAWLLDELEPPELDDPQPAKAKPFRDPGDLIWAEAQAPNGLGSRQTRSNGSRHACGAMSWWIAFGPHEPWAYVRTGEGESSNGAETAQSRSMPSAVVNRVWSPLMASRIRRS